MSALKSSKFPISTIRNHATRGVCASGHISQRKFDRTAFVVMPFVEKGSTPRSIGFFTEVLKSLIADLVIADLTDHNPNVLFELGIRLAKELPVALIKAEGTGPIFDVDNMIRVAPYSPNLWASSISTDLPRLLDHIKAGKSYMQILTGRAANRRWTNATGYGTHHLARL